MPKFCMIQVAKNIYAELIFRQQARNGCKPTQASRVQLHHLSAVIVLEPAKAIGKPMWFDHLHGGVHAFRRYHPGLKKGGIGCRLQQPLSIYPGAVEYTLQPFSHIVCTRPNT